MAGGGVRAQPCGDCWRRRAHRAGRCERGSTWAVAPACAAALLGCALLAPATATELAGVRQWPLAGIQPGHSDDRDLQPFAQAIGQARVVALGEQTHGGAEEFLLKTRLVKYLSLIHI